MQISKVVTPGLVVIGRQLQIPIHTKRRNGEQNMYAEHRRPAQQVNHIIGQAVLEGAATKSQAQPNRMPAINIPRHLDGFRGAARSGRWPLLIIYGII